MPLPSSVRWFAVVRRRRAVALLAAPLLLAPLLSAAACGTGETGVPASQAAPVGGGPQIGGTRAATAPPARAGIATKVTSVGTVITSDGFTLYRYAKDDTAPSRSACTGGCATTWPPVVAKEPLGGTGLDPELLGSVARPDGKQQLTVDGWPVYRFVRDTAPGEVKGQGGAGGAWTAIGFDGRPVATASNRDAPPPP